MIKNKPESISLQPLKVPTIISISLVQVFDYTGTFINLKASDWRCNQMKRLKMRRVP